MLSVCIVAPYTKSETTFAAIQIAGWLRRIGLTVYFLSTTPVYPGIHRYWDNNAISVSNISRRLDFVRLSTHICFFDSDPLIKEKSKTKKTIFFPGWSWYWNKDYEVYLRESDRIICLSHAMSDWLDLRYNDINKVWASIVSPDSLLVPKHGVLDHHSYNFLVYIPRSYELDVSTDYASVFNVSNYKVRFSFVFEKSLSKPYRKQFNKLNATQYKSYPTYKLGSLARQHDVVYIANTRHMYGSVFSMFNAYNTPIICNHVTPVLEHVPTNIGCIIPATSYEKPIPVSDICPSAFLNNLDYICNNFAPWLKTIQDKQLVNLVHAQLMFEPFIRSEFNV